MTVSKLELGGDKIRENRKSEFIYYKHKHSLLTVIAARIAAPESELDLRLLERAEAAQEV